MTPVDPARTLVSSDAAAPAASAAARTLVLVGNPNVGKSVVFGALTGTYVTVSNYPGTTVEISRASAQLGAERWRVLDSPGTNSLVPLSEDEAVTRDVLLSERDAVAVQVCDAKNLRRALIVTSQLAEAGIPFTLCLNMADEALERGIVLDTAALSKALGVPVVETVAIRGRGLDALRAAVPTARVAQLPPIAYSAPVANALERLGSLLPSGLPIHPRALALMVLSSDANDDPSLWRQLEDRMGAARASALREAREELVRALPESPRVAIARARLAWADGLIDRVQRRVDTSLRATLARRFGELAVHPVWGLPVLAAVLFIAYELVGVFGAGTAVNFLEHTVFGGYLVPWTEALVRWITPAGRVQEFLVGPAGAAAESGGLIVGKYGLMSMALSYGIAIVLPIVTTFFLFFSVLEDSGYLPRLAVLVNRAFKAMGLNGKAVLPMVLGLGCDTMATMTTRILETKKERLIVTLLLALGVPCSAQLGVILGMLSGLSLWGALWWSLSVVGTVLLVGFLAAKVLPGKGSDFLLELPPIRRPQLSNILIKTVARLEWYLREALPLFILGTAVLWTLDFFGLVAGLERIAAPVVQGILGLPREATGAFIIGFLRRDYGAAGLFALFHESAAGGYSHNTEIQVVVAMVTITLFIPCIANFFVIVKERGWKTAVAVAGFIFPFAIGVGGLVNLAMRHL